MEFAHLYVCGERGFNDAFRIETIQRQLNSDFCLSMALRIT
jgi:hypothetical protein